MKMLAEATGTRINTIWRIENGRANPSWELAIKISQVLHCTLDEISAHNVVNKETIQQ